MKNKKIIIGIVVVLAIYAIFMIVMLNKGNKDLNNGKYLIINNKLNLRFDNGKYIKVPYSEIENSKLSFKTYVDSEYFGNYYLKYGSTWNLFDEKDEFKLYNGSLIAFSDNYKLNVKKLKSRNISDSEKAFITNNFGINNFDFLVTNEVYDIDLDNNNVMDKIICLSNSYFYSLSDVQIDNYNIKNNYSIIIAIINKKTIVIKKEIGKQDLNVYNVIGAFNNDAKEINIIVEKTIGYISEEPTEIDELFLYDNNQKKFKKIISN